MKLTLTALASALILNAHADRIPVDKATADALNGFFMKNVSMEPDDDFKRVGKFFEGAAIYELWMKQEDGFAGMQMAVMK